MNKKRKPWVLILLCLLAVAGIIYAFLPKPIEADLVSIRRGSLKVYVEEDGQTRIRDRYIVSSPLAGHLSRVALDPGDEVIAGQTLLAIMEAPLPALLDDKMKASAEAALLAAKKAEEVAQAALTEANARLAFATASKKRLESLVGEGASKQELEEAEYKESAAVAAQKTADFMVNIKGFEREQAEAALLQFTTDSSTDQRARIEIKAPVNGKVLRVFQESSAVIPAGTAILELGNPADLEVEIDVLSEDAVGIRSGQKVLLERWGGHAVLEAMVSRVDPSGFTKVSALGVDEQRVWVIAAFTGGAANYEMLGDRFRVEAKIIVWEKEDVLKIPSGALLGEEGNWSAFVVKDGLVWLRKLEIGKINGLEAEILQGLAEGEEVVLDPSDAVKDGVSIKRRK